MEIEIKTGFQKVFHDINFQPTTEKKGKNLADCGHVKKVTEYRKNGISYLIAADVIRQTSVNDVPYKTKLNIDESRKIITSSCTCVYNESKKCKHVAALIYFVNFNESLSKTDEEQVWGRPTARQFANEKYRKGKYFDEMFSSKGSSAAPYEFNVDDLKQPSALKMMKLAESDNQKNEFATKAVMNKILDEVNNILKIGDCAACVEVFHLNCLEYEIYSGELTLDDYLKNFYNSSICVTESKVIDLCCETLTQSQCQKWFQERRIRISSSKGVHNIKSRNKKSIDNLVDELLNLKNLALKCLKYDIENEKYAKIVYERQFQCDVIQVGLIISVHQPWLCTSLDGVVIENGCISRIVEFKCPSTCQEIPVIDLVNKKCNVPYLEFIDNQVLIKKNHPYYTQCQTQMYVTGMSECDLFVYSPVENGCCTVRIVRDESFLKTVIIKCENFYFKYYLPTAHSIMNKENKNKKDVGNEVQPSRVFTGKDIVNNMK